MAFQFLPLAVRSGNSLAEELQSDNWRWKDGVGLQAKAVNGGDGLWHTVVPQMSEGIMILGVDPTGEV